MGSCSGITGSGDRCRAIAITGSEYCHAHHPDRADARRRSASKGGKRGGRGRPQVEIADIKRRLSELADGVLDGSVDKGTGAVVSQILNVLLRAVSVELKVREQEEILTRVEELETLMEQQKREGRRGA